MASSLAAFTLLICCLLRDFVHDFFILFSDWSTTARCIFNIKMIRSNRSKPIHYCFPTSVIGIEHCVGYIDIIAFIKCCSILKDILNLSEQKNNKYIKETFRIFKDIEGDNFSQNTNHFPFFRSVIGQYHIF